MMNSTFFMCSLLSRWVNDRSGDVRMASLFTRGHMAITSRTLSLIAMHTGLSAVLDRGHCAAMV